ncbi:unnamed protein product [Amoebophrya sp. A120]|nr:unnamed protein product [Amoebophrya sp. A120]|eukprot:GSA120T00000764001.1
MSLSRPHHGRPSGRRHAALGSGAATGLRSSCCGTKCGKNSRGPRFPVLFQLVRAVVARIHDAASNNPGSVDVLRSSSSTASSASVEFELDPDADTSEFFPHVDVFSPGAATAPLEEATSRSTRRRGTTAPPEVDLDHPVFLDDQPTTSSATSRAAQPQQLRSEQRGGSSSSSSSRKTGQGTETSADLRDEKRAGSRPVHRSARSRETSRRSSMTGSSENEAGSSSSSSSSLIELNITGREHDHPNHLVQQSRHQQQHPGFYHHEDLSTTSDEVARVANKLVRKEHGGGSMLEIDGRATSTLAAMKSKSSWQSGSAAAGTTPSSSSSSSSALGGGTGGPSPTQQASFSQAQAESQSSTTTKTGNTTVEAPDMILAGMSFVGVGLVAAVSYQLGFSKGKLASGGGEKGAADLLALLQAGGVGNLASMSTSSFQAEAPAAPSPPRPPKAKAPAAKAKSGSGGSLTIATGSTAFGKSSTDVASVAKAAPKAKATASSPSPRGSSGGSPKKGGPDRSSGQTLVIDGLGVKNINLKAKAGKRIIKKDGDPPSPKKHLTWRDETSPKNRESVNFISDRGEDQAALMQFAAQMAAVEAAKEDRGVDDDDGEY